MSGVPLTQSHRCLVWKWIWLTYWYKTCVFLCFVFLTISSHMKIECLKSKEVGMEKPRWWMDKKRGQAWMDMKEWEDSKADREKNLPSESLDASPGLGNVLCRLAFEGHLIAVRPAVLIFSFCVSLSPFCRLPTKAKDYTKKTTTTKKSNKM